MTLRYVLWLTAPDVSVAIAYPVAPEAIAMLSRIVPFWTYAVTPAPPALAIT